MHTYKTKLNRNPGQCSNSAKPYGSGGSPGWHYAHHANHQIHQGTPTTFNQKSSALIWLCVQCMWKWFHGYGNVYLESHELLQHLISEGKQKQKTEVQRDWMKCPQKVNGWIKMRIWESDNEKLSILTPGSFIIHLANSYLALLSSKHFAL